MSGWHLAVTLLLVVIPFIFLLFLARFSGITPFALFKDFTVSFARILAAYGIALAIGWLLAISFYHGARSVIALPIFDVLQSFPTFAIVPLATHIFGASNWTIVFFLVITMVWPILFSIISSLKLIRSDWQEVVQISGLRGSQYIKNFLLPVTIPGIITGSIIGIGEGWEALVATEIIVQTQDGLGPFFQVYSYNPTITALGVIGFLLVIFSINKLVWLTFLERSHRMMEE
jgi:ABC-type nitrate/sulfonate/bicarbonate transport system permease component